MHSSEAMETFNLARELERIAAERPFDPGIIFPVGRQNEKGSFVQFSFQQLNQRVDRYAHGLIGFGARRGERCLVMLRPGVDLIAVVFALIKIGAVPVLIDPGMGLKAFLKCVSETQPTLMIGIPLAHLLKAIVKKPFKTITRCVIDGPAIFGIPTLKKLNVSTRAAFPAVATRLDEEAAVAFTSGGTGIPKGVVYEHGMFEAQIASMKRDLNIQPGEIHLAAMYIFALFNPALGVTTIIPDMDPRKTEKLNPARLVEAIQTFGVTMSLGSPTVWRLVGDYCRRNQIELPSVKHIFMFGAPVYPNLIESFQKLLPNGIIQTPYGATEALPLTTIDGKEVLDDTAVSTQKGKGVCVGKPVEGVEICIIATSDDPIEHFEPTLRQKPGVIGEICVKGSMVTKSYLNRPQKTREAKIQEGAVYWHRMGDLGYLDEKGRVWVCGRKAHRVETAKTQLLPICVEPLFNRHPAVFRSALVGVGELGSQTPVVLIETIKSSSQSGFDQLKRELRQIAVDAGLEFEHILQHPRFPVDVRHNAKIQRHILAEWAEKRIPT